MYAIKNVSLFITIFMEIVKSFKDKVLSTWNKQKPKKKILKNNLKSKKKFFYFKFNSNIIFYLKNCSCKSNLKYLIQLDNKFDNSLESKNFINSVQYINKNHKKKNYFFSRKIAKKNGSLRSFKNSEILAFFLTLSSLNLTHMQTKTPLTLPFILFPLQRKKYILQE